MKYLRTPYGIIDMSKYELVEETETKYVFYRKSARRNYYKEIAKSVVVASADALGTLFDEIIVKAPELPKPHIASVKSNEISKFIKKVDEETEVYGAIYVKKYGSFHLESVAVLINREFKLIRK